MSTSAPPCPGLRSRSVRDLPEDELLAHALGLPSGDAAHDACRLAWRALGGLRRAGRMSPAELGRELPELLGPGPEAAWRLAVAFELGRRSLGTPLPLGEVVRGAADLEEHLRGEFVGREKEAFLVVLLDAKNRPLRIEHVSEGCLTWSVVHPREVFAPAVRERAGALIVAHNHPSGDPEPSRQDLEVTERLRRVGDLLGIPLLDHIIVGTERCVSLRARGYLSGTPSA